MRKSMVTVALASMLLAAQRAPAEAQGGGTAPPAATSRALSAFVWVNTSTKVYHCPSSKFYGATNDGEFMSEAAARGRGNRAAEGAGCPAAASRAGRPKPPSKGMVWLDTATGRYHCPGSRAFAATDRGRFMAESEAKRAKHRAALSACR